MSSIAAAARAAITAGILGDDGFGDFALLYGRATRPRGKAYQASVAAGLDEPFAGLTLGLQVGRLR